MNGAGHTSWFLLGHFPVSQKDVAGVAKQTAKPMLLQDCVRACYADGSCNLVSQPLPASCTARGAAPAAAPAAPVPRPCYLWSALSNMAQLAPPPQHAAEGPCAGYLPGGAAMHVILQGSVRAGEHLYVPVQGIPADVVADVPSCSYARTESCNSNANVECPSGTCLPDVGMAQGNAHAAAVQMCTTHPDACARGFVLDTSNVMYALLPAAAAARGSSRSGSGGGSGGGSGSGSASRQVQGWPPGDETPPLLQNRYITYLRAQERGGHIYVTIGGKVVDMGSSADAYEPPAGVPTAVWVVVIIVCVVFVGFVLWVLRRRATSVIAFAPDDGSDDDDDG